MEASNVSTLARKLLCAILAVSLAALMVPVVQTGSAEAKTVKVKSIKLYYGTSKKSATSTKYVASTSKAIGSTLRVNLGTKLTLRAKFNPTKASNKKLTYRSSNKKVATVSSKGRLKAVGAGTARITVTSRQNKKVKKSFKIVVSKATRRSAASLTVQNKVAYGSKSVKVSVKTSKNLASALKCSMVTTSGLLKGYKASSIKKTASRSFDVTLTWSGTGSKPTPTASKRYGYLTLAASGFASGSSVAQGVVSVEKATGHIEANEDLTDFDPSTQTLSIPVDISPAVAKSTISASDISMPKGEDAPAIVGAVVTSNPSMIKVQYKLSKGTYGADFANLNTALAEGGLKIKGAAVNLDCDLSVRSDEVETGKSCGFETTALDYLQPSIIGQVDKIEWSEDPEDGTLCAELTVDLDALSTYGSVDLVNNETVSEAVTWENLNPYYQLFALSGKPSFVDDHTLSFVLEMNAELAQVLDAIGADEEVTQQVRDIMLDQALTEQALFLDPALVKNNVGMPAGKEVSVHLFRKGAYDPRNSQVNGGLSALEADEDDDPFAEDEEEPDWDQIRSVSATIVESAGALAWGFLGPEGLDWAHITEGIAGFLGMGADEEQYSMADIMDKLSEMDTTLNQVSGKVDRIGTRLDEIESRTIYQSHLSEFKKLLNANERLASPVSNGIGEINENTPAGTTALTPEALESAKKMAEKTKYVSTKVNGASSTLQKLLEFSDMLASDSGIGSKSIVEEYADYINTYYNWQPESCDAVSAFYTRAMLAFQCGYQAAYNEIMVDCYDADSQKMQKNLQESTDFKLLVEATRKVATTLCGKMVKGADGKWKVAEESKVSKLTYVDEDATSVKNNVNGQAYSKDAFCKKTFFGDNTQTAVRSYFKPDAEDNDCPDGTGSLTQAHWESMIERLGNSDYENIYEELKGVGFDLSSLEGKNSLKDYCVGDWDVRKLSYTEQEIVECTLLIGKTYRTNPEGSTSDWQRYIWYGPVLDAKKNTVVDQQVLMAYDFFYANGWPWNWHWGSDYTPYTKWVVE